MPHVGVKGPRGALQQGLLRDGVVLASSLDGAHRDHAALHGVHPAGDDLLQRQDHVRSQQDCVCALVRIRAVAALAHDLHLEEIGGSHQWSRSHRDAAHGILSGNV